MLALVRCDRIRPVRVRPFVAAAVASLAICGAFAAPDAAAWLVVPPPEVCEEAAAIVEDTFDVRAAVSVVPSVDVASGATGLACAAVATGDGATFGPFLEAAATVAAGLRGAGWSEDDRYLADGPTGTSSGWRRADDLAILTVAWEPMPEAACPPDEPIFACEVAPEHQAFTVTLTVARTDPGAAADADTVPAAAGARALLAAVLQAEREEVVLVDLERTDWGDACLGVLRPDVMCAQVVTPGYRATFEAPGGRYVVHTDALGSTVLLAAAPHVDVSGAVASWHGAGPDGECLQAHALGDVVAVGRCHGPLLPGRFVRAEHRRMLDALADRFGSTRVETTEGILVFEGRGHEDLGGPRARTAAELVRAMAIEAAAGRTGASWSVVMTYHDPAGERCHGPSVQLDGRVLTVMATGLASVWACRDGEVVPVAVDVALADHRLEWLYDVMDRHGSLATPPSEDGAAAPTLVFSGRGAAPAGEEADAATAVVQDLARWARDLLDDLGRGDGRAE